MKLTPEKIKSIREEMKLSVTDFAKKVGYSYATVNKWEKENKLLPKVIEEKIKQLHADFKTKKLLDEKHQITVSADDVIPYGYTASKLRRIRIEMGLNTEGFAKVLGSAGSSVNRWETGKGLINKVAASNLHYAYESFLKDPSTIEEYRSQSVRQPKEYFERKINELFAEINNLKKKINVLENR